MERPGRAYVKPSLPVQFASLPDVRNYLAQLQGWAGDVDKKLALAYGMASFLSGSPSGPTATLSIPHVDSWLFEDNVDGGGGFPANLRYVVAATTQRIATAKLSIHLAKYRTYSTLTLSSTGTESATHTHSGGSTGGESGHSHSHAHSITIIAGTVVSTVGFQVATPTSGSQLVNSGGGNGTDTASINSDGGTGSSGHTHGQGTTNTESATHTHSVSGTTTLGVSEGAVATGVTIKFINGKTGATVDATAALGGPFNADVVELDITRYLPQDKGVWHTVQMQPSGLGRIEAHLRLSVFVNAAGGF